MKLSKIAAICNKTKHIALFTQDDEEKTQWAGDGFAAYALLGMPKFTADTIMNTFGVEKSKKDVWLIDDVPLPEKFDVSVYRNSDVSGMIDLDSYVTYLGNSYIPVLVTDRRYYINKKVSGSDQVHGRNSADRQKHRRTNLFSDNRRDVPNRTDHAGEH